MAAYTGNLYILPYILYNLFLYWAYLKSIVCVNYWYIIFEDKIINNYTYICDICNIVNNNNF